jgi:ABC-type amino acid transport substrate-binding protein
MEARHLRQSALVILLGGAVALIAGPTVVSTQTPASRTLDRIRDTGRIRLGYRVDARPFSFRDASGNASGYSIALCQRVVDAVKTELQKPDLTVQWVPMPADYRFVSLQQDMVDVLCGADTPTLDRRAGVSFSIPIYPGGIGALMRADAPAALRDVLNGRGQPYHPTWRAAASQIIQARSFAAVNGTTGETWLTQRIDELDVITKPITVSNYAEGIQAVLTRRADALFGERGILLDAAHRDTFARQLVVLDRLFTNEPLALAIGPNDDRFRLLVDRSLSQFYQSGQLGAVYTSWFGTPDANAIAFFRSTALAD